MIRVYCPLCKCWFSYDSGSEAENGAAEHANTCLVTHGQTRHTVKITLSGETPQSIHVGMWHASPADSDRLGRPLTNAEVDQILTSEFSV